MDYEKDNTDYGDMDDLALPDHIEYNHDQPEEFSNALKKEKRVSNSQSSEQKTPPSFFQSLW